MRYTILILPRREGGREGGREEGRKGGREEGKKGRRKTKIVMRLITGYQKETVYSGY